MKRPGSRRRRLAAAVVRATCTSTSTIATPAGLQTPADLGEDRGVVRGEREHVVAEDHVERSPTEAAAGWRPSAGSGGAAGGARDAAGGPGRRRCSEPGRWSAGPARSEWRGARARSRAPRSRRGAAAGRSAAGRAEGPGGGASTRSPDRGPAAASARSGRMPGTGPRRPDRSRRVGPRARGHCTGPGRRGRPGAPRGLRKTRSPGAGVSYTRRTGWAGCPCTGVLEVATCRVARGWCLPCVLLGGPAAADEWSVKTVPRTDGSGHALRARVNSAVALRRIPGHNGIRHGRQRVGGGDLGVEPRRKPLGHRPRRRSGAPGADGPARWHEDCTFRARSTGDWSSSSRRGTAFACSSGSGRSGRRPGRTRPPSV